MTPSILVAETPMQSVRREPAGCCRTEARWSEASGEEWVRDQRRDRWQREAAAAAREENVPSRTGYSDGQAVM